MKFCVFGTWHLGSVTAACLAEAGYRTVGLDYDSDVVAGLQAGEAPLFEPDLNELIARGLSASLLSFSSDPSEVADCDVVWVTFDTPVDDNDVADTESVVSAVRSLFPHIRDGAVILISSQLPVGSTRALAKDFARQEPNKSCDFAYSPENLRLGRALEIFKNAERIIVGSENSSCTQEIAAGVGTVHPNGVVDLD